MWQYTQLKVCVHKVSVLDQHSLIKQSQKFWSLRPEYIIQGMALILPSHAWFSISKSFSVDSSIFLSCLSSPLFFMPNMLTCSSVKKTFVVLHPLASPIVKLIAKA